MGSEFNTDKFAFTVKTAGSFKQKPRFDYSDNMLGKEDWKNLQYECYNSSSERKIIERIEEDFTSTYEMNQSMN